MHASLHSAIDREHEQYLFLPLYGNAENSWQFAPPESISHSERVFWCQLILELSGWLKTSESAITLRFQSCLKFYRMFWTKRDSELNTSAITAVTKSSTKPWSSATTNCHLRGSGERNQVQRRTKVSFSRTMMWALQLLQLAKRHIYGQSDVEQWRNRAHSLSSYRVMLVWRRKSVSQIVSQ